MPLTAGRELSAGGRPCPHVARASIDASTVNATGNVSLMADASPTIQALAVAGVASGGAGNPSHLVDAIQKGKADAALAASIFHFGQFTIAETKQVMRDAGIPVRL